VHDASRRRTDVLIQGGAGAVGICAVRRPRMPARLDIGHPSSNRLD
jgi:hypothetical protein